MRLNRFATIAAVPLMAFAAMLAFRYGTPGEATVPGPDAGILAVANLRDEQLLVFDLARPGIPARALRLPGPPHEMVQARGRLYITLGRVDALVEVDPAAPAVLRILSLPGNPHGIVLQDGHLWVTLDDAGEVVRIPLDTLTVDRRIPTGRTPHAVAILGDTLLVTDTGDANLRLIATGSVSLIPTGDAPESIATSAGWSATADSGAGTVTLIPPGGGTPASFDAGPRPSRVIPAGDGRFAVALNGGASVVIFDTGGGLIARLDSGPVPDGLCTRNGWLASTSTATGLVRFHETAGWRPATLELNAGAGAGACLWLE